MIYSQLRKKIEEQKRQFQNSLKEIKQINTSPKIFLPYETKNPNSSPNNSPQTKIKQNEITTPAKIDYKVDEELITKLKQITEIKRQDKVAKITSQLEHYRKKSVLLSSELTLLKNKIKQKDEEMALIQNGFKQKIIKSAEKQAKIEQQEINLKTIIKDLRQILIQRDGQIAKLEGKIYEYEKQRQEIEEQLLKQSEISKLVKEQNQKLELTLTQLKQIVSTFIDNIVTKIKLFDEPILQIIQLKTEVISKNQESLFFEQLQIKMKSMKQSIDNKNNQLILFKKSNQQLQKQLKKIIQQRNEFRLILELKQNQIGKESYKIQKLQGQLKEMINKVELDQKRIDQLTTFNNQLAQKIQILNKEQKEIEVKCQKKIEILVNQIKKKADQIKDIKSELESQNQIFEKDKKQAQVKIIQKHKIIQQYQQIYSQMKDVFSQFIPRKNQQNQICQIYIQRLLTKLLDMKQQIKNKTNIIQLFQTVKDEKQIFKVNYLKMEIQRLILQSDKRLLQNELKSTLIQLYQQKQQNQSLKNNIQQKQLQKQEKNSVLQSKQKIEKQMNDISEVMNKMKLNCLKNNCDSIGIMSIELSKILGVQQKILQVISSPTDFQRFNKLGIINTILQFQLQYDQKQSESKLNNHEQESSEEELQRKIQRKKSQDVCKVRFQQNKQRNTKKDIKVKSVSLIEEQQPKQIKQTSKQAFSIENNPDVPQIVIPYSQLLQKYKDLKCDLQKMQEYICYVHSVNFKLKKGIQQADQHNKHNSIDKLSEKLSILVKHNQAFLKSESQQFTNEISKILNEIQNYIHFVDQITKIEPFTHQYSKSINKLNKLKRKVTKHIKMEKQGAQKHAYSEGDSRQDDFVDHFDPHPYEQDQDFPLIQSQPKEIDKKQDQGMQKYFQQRRQLYSQISSVKNKSLKSYNSFMNSRSQLWQLVKNKFTQDFQQHDHDVFKKQSNDSQRLSQMSIKEIKTKYHKLKKQNRSLNKVKNHFQKHCKKLENQQQDYKKKIAKMTKQFNDSFKFLCQVSGKQITPNKDKLKVNPSCNKESPIETVTSPKILKIHKISVRDQIIKRPEQIKIQTKEEIKQLELQNQLLKIKIKEMQKKIDQLSKANEIKVRTFELKIKKHQQQFETFIKKIISKAATQPRIPVISPRIVLQNNRDFRKNSNSFKEVQVSISPQRQDPVNLAELYQILNKVLHIEKNQQFNQKINLKQFQQIVFKSIQKQKKLIYIQVVSLVRQKLQKFIHIYTQQQRIVQLQKVQNLLAQQFQNNQNINELCLLGKEIILSLKRQSGIEIENLSINSHCQELKKPIYQEKGVQNQEENKITEQQVHKIQQMKKQIYFLRQQNNQLQEYINELNEKVQQKNKIIQIQNEQIVNDKQKIKQRLVELENHNNQLRVQVQKSKLKEGKKNKIYHIGY